MRTVRTLLMTLMMLVCGLAVAGGQPVLIAAETAGFRPELTGLWQGAAFFSTVRAELVQEATPVNEGVYAFSGVVTIDDGASKGVYHVFGYVNDQTVAGVHPPSGAQFVGALNTPDELRGTITFKSGRQMDLTVARMSSPQGVGAP